MWNLNEIATDLSLFIEQSKMNVQYLEIIVMILFGVFITTQLFPPLIRLGIWPRRIWGLPGIFFAPLLHLNFNHLFFNCIPLLILSDFILIYGLPYYLMVTAYIAIMSGFLIWCFAKPGIHVGASAVITGYWGFLVLNIYQQGTVMSIFLGIICLYYFAGIFLGIFPREKGVSWEGHLFGLLAGFATSYGIKMGFVYPFNTIV